MNSTVSRANQAQPVADEDSSYLGRVRRRAALDALWQRKLEECVALSAACSGTASVGDDQLAKPTALPSLPARTTRAFEDLAAIEDAVARIDDGTYGLCATCGQRMPEEWLTEEPQARHCPDCALQQVAWNSLRARSAPQPAQVVPAGPTVPWPAPASSGPHQPSAAAATAALPLPA